jgi:hypothetical protein
MKYRPVRGGAVVTVTQTARRKFRRRTQRQGEPPHIPCSAQRSTALTGTGGREMQMDQAQAKTREKISLGSLMLTIVISNIAVLFFIAPYA